MIGEGAQWLKEISSAIATSRSVALIRVWLFETSDGKEPCKQSHGSPENSFRFLSQHPFQRTDGRGHERKSGGDPEAEADEPVVVMWLVIASDRRERSNLRT